MLPYISNSYARSLYAYAAATVDLFPDNFTQPFEPGGQIYYSSQGLWEAYYVDSHILAFKVDGVIMSLLPNLKLSTLKQLHEYLKLSKGSYREFILGFSLGD